jgi:hypothetical protein
VSIGGLTCVHACAAPPQELNHSQSLLAGTYQQLNVVSTQHLQAQTGLKQGRRACIKLTSRLVAATGGSDWWQPREVRELNTAQASLPRAGRG